MLDNLHFEHEDSGSPIEHSGAHFRSSFQRGEYSIWPTFLSKVLRMCVPEWPIGLPESSFGEHKVVGRCNRVFHPRSIRSTL